MNEPEYVIRPVIIDRTLIPPFVLDEVHRNLTIGKLKHNKTADVFTHETEEQITAHLYNHLEALARGEKVDKDGFYHQSAVAVRAMQLLYLQLTAKEG